MADSAPISNVSDILPLSPTQEGMLYEILADPGAVGRYESIQRVTLEGPLDETQFREIFTHEALETDVSRACFVHEGVPRPLQVIRSEVDLPFATEDWTGVADGAAQLEACEVSMLAEANALTVAPLMAVRLIRLAPARHVVLWKVHHLISDAWSARVVLDNTLARMNGAHPKPAGPAFRDHLARLNNRDREADRAFFRRYLAGLAAPCILAERASEGHGPHARLAFVIDDQTTARLRSVATAARATLATALSLAWALCLRRLTGVDDVVFGRVVSGRDPAIPEIAEAVGPYLGVSPARLRLDPSHRVRAALAVAEAEFNEIRPFETAALRDALSAMEENTGPRLPFDTLLSVQPPSSPSPRDALRITDITALDATSFPLSLIVQPGERIGVEAVHDPARLSADTVRDILEMFGRVLKGMGERPDATLAEVPGLPLPAIAAAPEAQFVHDAIRAQAEVRPEAIAVRCNAQTLSYGELHARACGLAGALRDAGVGRGDILPVTAARSASTPVAMLATLYAGAAYAPIDPTYPIARNRAAFDMLSARMALGDTPLPGWEGPTLRPGDFENSVTPSAFVQQDTHADDPAYVVFTSGSTGAPKGVVVSHGNLAWSTAARKQVYGAPPPSFLHLSSFAFDSSVVGLYWTLCGGGALTIAPMRAEQDAAGVFRLAQEVGATHLLALPRLWMTMLEVAPAPATLQTVIVAGEAAPQGLVARHRSRAAKVRLYNEYGPSEATVWCAAAEISDEAGIPSIGCAPPGAALDVCDADGGRMPRGMRGELVVRGAGVAQGYLGKDPDHGGFISDPSEDHGARGYRTGDIGSERADGALLCHGRRDGQVKIRGRRVELGEIEAAAAAEGVSAAAALRSERVLLATVDPPDDLAVRLARRLSEEARPAAIHAVSSLPRLPNGKIDRKAVAGLGFDGTGTGTGAEGDASGFLETTLAALWADALGKPVGPASHFFDSGGDSLMSIGVMNAAKTRGLTLQPGDLFEHPVLGELAAVLRARFATPVPFELGSRRSVAHPEGSETPVLMIHGSQTFNGALAAALGPDRPCIFNWSHHFSGGASLRDRVETLAEEAVQAMCDLRPDGPCVIIGYSFGGVIALEAAHRLSSAGRLVANLILVDPSYDVASPVGQGEEWGALARRWLLAGLFAARAVRSGIGQADAARHTAHVYRAILAPHRPRTYTGPVALMQTKIAASHGAAIEAALPGAERIALPYRHLQLLEDQDAITDVVARLVACVRAREKESHV